MQTLNYIKRHSVIATTIGLVVVAVAIISGRLATVKLVADSLGNNIKHITLVDASVFQTGTSTVAAEGIVESVSQVDLKSQVSAPVAFVNATVGDSVYAGETIIQLQNADIRAQLDQAKANLALAQGQYGSGSISLESTKTSAVEKIRAGYLAASDVVYAKIDQFLFNTVGQDSSMSSYVSDPKVLDELHSVRTDIDNFFVDWKTKVDALTVNSSDTDVITVLATSKANLLKINVLLADMSDALNTRLKNIPASSATTISGWTATVNAARGIITGTIADLTGADASFSGATSNHSSSAEAQISIATAGVKSLEAQLAKTYIVSPISGKTAAMPLRVGELASPGMLLATVVGGGGIQVKAFASSEDFGRIVKGASAVIEGRVKGTVLSVAPSVNAVNKKIEVDVLVDEPEKSGIVIGQNASVSINTGNVASLPKNDGTISFRVPIQDIKIVPGDAYIFTVDEHSKAVKHSVVLGKVDGDFVFIESGLTSDMQIASPVYGLEDGQTISAQ
jgi:multidrug efflux pump subunit AcrA (membrane-fusion protein)